MVLKGGESFSYHSPFNEILFIIEGQLVISSEEEGEKMFDKDQMIFLFPGCYCRLEAETPVTYYLFRLDENIHFCEKFSLHKLLPLKRKQKILFYPLPMNERAKDFVQSLQIYENDDILSAELMNMKITEYSLLLYTYYPKEELARFFSPLLHDNYRFYEFVLKSYQAVKMARELAELSGYSSSGFEKEFRRIFGTSPYRWMMRMKMNRISRELKFSDKPMKEIAEENGFATLSGLSDFCKKTSRIIAYNDTERPACNQLRKIGVKNICIVKEKN